MRSSGSVHGRLLPALCLVPVLSAAFCLGCGQSSERTAELSGEARTQVIQKKVDVKHRAASRSKVKASADGRDRPR
jgi:hypothetical protein